MKRFFIPLILLLLPLCAAAQEYGVVNISVCNLRETPNFTAQMVSQALLGTPVEVLGISDNGNPWPEVVTPDDYNGWVHYAAITLMDKEQLKAWNRAPKVVVTAFHGMVYDKPYFFGATVSDVVAGDRLAYLGKHGFWYWVGFPDGRKGYLPMRDGKTEEQWRKHLDQSADAILATARAMTGFPYVWGGMSPNGMDCSGFVRTVLFMHDIIIPRDASDQAAVGQRINIRDNLIPGDLVFFGSIRDDGKPRVSHVGFYLGNGRFIHCMGLVQIGSFNTSDPLYDAYNTGRYLFGTRFLPFIDKQEGINTTLSNPFYAK